MIPASVGKFFLYISNLLRAFDTLQYYLIISFSNIKFVLIGEILYNIFTSKMSIDFSVFLSHYAIL